MPSYIRSILPLQSTKTKPCADVAGTTLDMEFAAPSQRGANLNLHTTGPVAPRRLRRPLASQRVRRD